MNASIVTNHFATLGQAVCSSMSISSIGMSSVSSSSSSSSSSSRRRRRKNQGKVRKSYVLWKVATLCICQSFSYFVADLL